MSTQFSDFKNPRVTLSNDLYVLEINSDCLFGMPPHSPSEMTSIMDGPYYQNASFDMNMNLYESRQKLINIPKTMNKKRH